MREKTFQHRCYGQLDLELGVVPGCAMRTDLLVRVSAYLSPAGAYKRTLLSRTNRTRSERPQCPSIEYADCLAQVRGTSFEQAAYMQTIFENCLAPM